MHACNIFIELMSGLEWNFFSIFSSFSYNSNWFRLQFLIKSIEELENDDHSNGSSKITGNTRNMCIKITNGIYILQQQQQNKENKNKIGSLNRV